MVGGLCMLGTVRLVTQPRQVQEETFFPCQNILALVRNRKPLRHLVPFIGAVHSEAGMLVAVQLVRLVRRILPSVPANCTIRTIRTIHTIDTIPTIHTLRTIRINQPYYLHQPTVPIAPTNCTNQAYQPYVPGKTDVPTVLLSAFRFPPIRVKGYGTISI